MPVLQVFPKIPQANIANKFDPVQRLNTDETDGSHVDAVVMAMGDTWKKQRKVM